MFFGAKSENSWKFLKNQTQPRRLKIWYNLSWTFKSSQEKFQNSTSTTSTDIWNQTGGLLRGPPCIWASINDIVGCIMFSGCFVRIVSMYFGIDMSYEMCQVPYLGTFRLNVDIYNSMSFVKNTIYVNVTYCVSNITRRTNFCKSCFCHNAVHNCMRLVKNLLQTLKNFPVNFQECTTPSQVWSFNHFFLRLIVCLPSICRCGTRSVIMRHTSTRSFLLSWLSALCRLSSWFSMHIGWRRPQTWTKKFALAQICRHNRLWCSFVAKLY